MVDQCLWTRSIKYTCINSAWLVLNLDDKLLEIGIYVKEHNALVREVGINPSWNLERNVPP
jgi:hypothetical protein